MKQDHNRRTRNPLISRSYLGCDMKTIFKRLDYSEVDIILVLSGSWYGTSGVQVRTPPQLVHEVYEVSGFTS
jgi:hypothetical protein